MAECPQKIVDEQQTHSLHYYHEVKWRLLAETPWLAITLGLAVILSAVTLSSKGQFAPDTVPNIVTLGFLLLPMILLIASGDADLSSGMLAGLVCQIVNFLHWQIGMRMAILISLPVALLVGLTNGLLVSFAKLKGIFVTFGMSYILYGLIIVWHILLIPKLPVGLSILSRSPLILWLWILLVLGCAALMIFTPLGHQPQAGRPSSWNRLLYKGLPFVFSSFMAWISGVLLLSWLGYSTMGAGSGFTEIVLLATLLGGTAYYARTGFVLSGAMALIAIILFRQTLNLSIAEENVILGVLLLIMLPIAQYYHIGVDWLYCRQIKKTKAVSSKDTMPPGGGRSHAN